jgi:hypothetical protein
MIIPNASFFQATLLTQSMELAADVLFRFLGCFPEDKEKMSEIRIDDAALLMTNILILSYL